MSELAPSDPRRIDGYTILGRLGTGGFGTVYRASSPTGTEVALKVLRPELADNQLLRERLAREGFAIRKVQGNRTVKVFDVVTQGQSPYLVMELLEGEDLESYVTNRGPLQGPFLWSFIEGLVEAISDIHSAGIVHRDLKPSNVFFGPEGVKVLDFGVSAVAEHTALTQTGAFIGTAAWLSPEQVQTGDVGPQSDLFNLGLVVAFLATGSHPFGSGRADAVMYRICNAEPNLIHLSEPVRELVSRCLKKKELDRPSVTALQAFLNSDGQTWKSGNTKASSDKIETPDLRSNLVAKDEQTSRTRFVQRSIAPEVPFTPEPETPNDPHTSKQRKSVRIAAVLALVVGLIVAGVAFAFGSKQNEAVLGSDMGVSVSKSSVPTEQRKDAFPPTLPKNREFIPPVTTQESPISPLVPVVPGSASPQKTVSPIQISTTTTPSVSTSQPVPTPDPIPTTTSISTTRPIPTTMPVSTSRPIPATVPTSTIQASGSYSLSVAASSCGEGCIRFLGVANLPFPIDFFNALNITHYNSSGMGGASSIANRWEIGGPTSWGYEMLFRYPGYVSCEARWDFGLSYVKDGEIVNDRTPRATISDWSGVLPGC